ncbi:hypothetical protein, partial [Nocardioides pyridinolyticus]
TPGEGSNFNHLAEVLGRYSNPGPAGVRLEKARSVAGAERRAEPWSPHELSGAHRVRAVLNTQADEIRERYAAGETCMRLARDYGVPESTMRDFLRRQGIVMRPLGKIAAADVPDMVQLRESGCTYREIGEKYGVTRHAVAMRLGRRPTC